MPVIGTRITNRGMKYRDRQANLRLIRYFIRHTSDKKLNKILNIVSDELAKRGSK